MPLYTKKLIKEEVEVVLERGAVQDKNNNFAVFVSSDGDYNVGEGSGYFKWIDSYSFSDYKNMARIRFEEPVYIIHHKDVPSQHYELKSKEIKSMIKLLQSPINQKAAQKINSQHLRKYINTNWDYLLYSHNQMVGASDEQILLDIKHGILSNSNMIHMNTPMPNYLALR